MRIKLTVVLLLLNAVLFTALYYLGQGEKDDNKESRLIFPPGMAENADRIRFEVASGGDELDWVMENRNGDWIITEPFEWPANVHAVTAILTQLKMLEWETRFQVEDLESAGKSLADYNLDEPQFTITLERGGQQLDRLRIGAPTEVGNRLYAVTGNGEEVVVIKQDLLKAAAADPQYLRSAEVFSIPVFEVRSMTVKKRTGENESLTVRLTRQQTEWSMEAPIQTAASRPATEAAISSLSRMRIVAFGPAKPTEQGLDKPALRITLEGNNRRQTLEVGNTVPESQPEQYYARLEGSQTVFTIPAGHVAPLGEAQVILRDRRFLRFDPVALTKIEIGGGGKIVSLLKTETGAWKILRKTADGALDTWEADPELLRDFIRILELISAEKFESDAPAAADLETYGLSDPVRRVTLEAGGRTIKLLVGVNPDKNLHYAKLESEPFVYQVNRAILSVFKLSSLDYRNRTLNPQLASATVRSVRVFDMINDEAMIEESNDPAKNSWAKQLESYPQKKRDALLGIIATLKQFKVKAFLREGFTQYGFPLDDETLLPWQFRVDVEFALPGGENQVRKWEIYATERVGGMTQFGGTRDPAFGFALMPDTIEQLFTLTQRRAPPPVEEETPPETAPAPPPAKPVEDQAPEAE